MEVVDLTERFVTLLTDLINGSVREGIYSHGDNVVTIRRWDDKPYKLEIIFTCKSDDPSGRPLIIVSANWLPKNILKPFFDDDSVRELATELNNSLFYNVAKKTPKFAYFWCLRNLLNKDYKFFDESLDEALDYEHNLLLVLFPDSFDKFFNAYSYLKFSLKHKSEHLKKSVVAIYDIDLSNERRK